MRPSRFHGELAPLEAAREEGPLPHLDVLWHYDCVVSPRSPSLSPRSHVAKLHAGIVSPLSPLHASGLFSPPSPLSSMQSVSSPVRPRSPAAALREGSRGSIDAIMGTAISPSHSSIRASSSGVLDATTIIPCLQDATNASMTCCAGSTASHQHQGSLQCVFSTFDEDGDGHVSIGELCAIFKKLGIPKSQDSIESLLASSPRSHIRGHIDQEEFFLLYDSVCAYVDELDSDAASSLGDMDADVDQDLRAAFHVFDLDGNGFISPEELQSVLCGLGFVQAQQLEACVDMIARVDENGDGHVDFSEFKKLMGSAMPTLILSC